MQSSLDKYLSQTQNTNYHMMPAKSNNSNIAAADYYQSNQEVSDRYQNSGGVNQHIDTIQTFGKTTKRADYLQTKSSIEDFLLKFGDNSFLCWFISSARQ